MLEDEPEKVPDTAALLEQLREILETARKLPMSASVSINRDEFGAILQDAIDGLPEELREARWLLKERDEVIDRAANEANRLVEAARVRAERMVEKNELVREARRTSEEILEDAERHAAHDPPRGRGLRRPQARRVRGGARPHDADRPEGPRAPPAACSLARGQRSRRRRRRLLRSGRPLIPVSDGFLTPKKVG